MGLKEDLEERRQRREAQAYFRQNNDQFFDGKTWATMIVVGILMALGLGAVNALITKLTNINFGIIIAFFGVLISNGLKKIAKTGNSKVAIVAGCCYFLMIFFSQAIYIFLVGYGGSLFLLQYLSIGSFIGTVFRSIFGSGILSLLIYGFGLYYCIMTATND